MHQEDVQKKLLLEASKQNGKVQTRTTITTSSSPQLQNAIPSSTTSRQHPSTTTPAAQKQLTNATPSHQTIDKKITQTPPNNNLTKTPSLTAIKQTNASLLAPLILPNHSSTSSSSSSSSSSSDDDEPLDGGWGWVVVFASFVAHIIADGCCYSAGILLVEWLQVFEESKAHTSWVPALFVSLHAIFGPISSICTNKFGCRVTTIAGGLIASLGCVLSTFATTVNQLCVTFGLIAGFGLSLVYVPVVVVVAFYFEKKRAFATGIAVAGSGVGGFVFPVLVELLIKWYTWRGAVLIMGGILLNIVLCGALFRPLVSFKEQRKHKKYLQSLHRFSRASSCREEIDQNGVCDHPPGEEVDCVFCQQNRADTPPVTRSLQLLPTFIDFDDVFKQYSEFSGKRKNSACLSQVLNATTAASSSAHKEKKSILTKKKEEKEESKETKKEVLKAFKIKKGSKKAHFAEHVVPKFPRDAYFRGSLWKTGFLHNQSASCPDIFVRSKKKSRSLREKLRLLWVALKDMLDLSVFRSPVFVCFCVHSLLLYVSYDIPYMYMPDLAQQLSISSMQSSYLLSVCGLASTFGQIVIGYVGDKPRVNSRYLYIAMMGVAGISTIFIPFLHQFSSFLVFCIVFGFTISANYCLTTIIIVELLGMEQLTNAYGFVTLSEGVANLVGVPLGGWLTDSTGTYDLAFYLSGVGVVISGLVLCLMPCLKRLDPLVRKKEEKEMAGRVNGHGGDDDDGGGGGLMDGRVERECGGYDDDMDGVEGKDKVVINGDRVRYGNDGEVGGGEGVVVDDDVFVVANGDVIVNVDGDDKKGIDSNDVHLPTSNDSKKV